MLATVVAGRLLLVMSVVAAASGRSSASSAAFLGAAAVSPQEPFRELAAVLPPGRRFLETPVRICGMQALFLLCRCSVGLGLGFAALLSGSPALIFCSYNLLCWEHAR